MEIDTFLTVGKRHEICQDYADRGSDFVVLADGCSTAEESNIGALLLTRAAKTCKKPILKAAEFAKAIELPENALCATLLQASVAINYFKIYVAGDGVVAVRNRGTTDWIVVEYIYPSGAPYYLRYSLDKDLEIKYRKEFGTTLTQKISEVSCKENTYSKNSFFNTWEDNGEGHFMSYDLAKFDAVAIFSDGVSSFIDENNTSIPTCEILTELLNFKNYAGKFVNRRCRAAFKSFAQKKWTHDDDFSMGVIYHEGSH